MAERAHNPAVAVPLDCLRAILEYQLTTSVYEFKREPIPIRPDALCPISVYCILVESSVIITLAIFAEAKHFFVHIYLFIMP